MYYSDIEFDEYDGLLNYLFAGDGMCGVNKHGKLFVFWGPFGVGKTTLANAMMAKLADCYRVKRVVTYTTRLPRSGEIAGILEGIHWAEEGRHSRYRRE